MKSLLLMMVVVALSGLAGAEVTDLRCEYQVNPVGIDCKAPRLSWQLDTKERGAQQVAYQVLVASTPELLAQHQGDLWDSGTVESDQTHLITYAGKPLASHQSCFWKVKAWQKGQPQAQWSSRPNGRPRFFRRTSGMPNGLRCLPRRNIRRRILKVRSGFGIFGRARRLKPWHRVLVICRARSVCRRALRLKVRN